MSKTPQTERKNQQKLNDSNEKHVGAQKSNQVPLLKPNKNSAEVLQKQVEFSYMNFDRRRSYEWKLSLALWTALSVFIALTLRGEVQIQSCLIKVVMAIAAILLVLLHSYFLLMLIEANSLDKKKSFYYEKALNILTNTDWEILGDPKSTELNDKMIKLNRGKYRNFPRFNGYWSCIVQVGITIILLIVAWIVLHEKPASKQIQSKNYNISLGFERKTTTQDQ